MLSSSNFDIHFHLKTVPSSYDLFSSSVSRIGFLLKLLFHTKKYVNDIKKAERKILPAFFRLLI